MPENSVAERPPMQPHPVAALLTDEQKARVKTAKFKRVRWPGGGGYRIATPRSSGGRCLCPLAVAAGLHKNSQPSPSILAALFDVDTDKNFGAFIDICNFTSLADSGSIAPADVYVLLGVEPPAGAS